MRIKQDFKPLRIVTTSAMLLSALILTFVCVSPNIVMAELKNSMAPALSSAIEKAHSDDVESALDEILEMKCLVEERRKLLLTFFPHGPMQELTEAIRAAEEIAATGEASQLLAELAAIESELIYMERNNKLITENLF